MPSAIVGREAEASAVDALLAAASTRPAALVFEGEPGIGKTTVWGEAVDAARERGFTVLTARASQAESILAYSSLADLLGGVDDAVLTSLPAPQRVSIDRVLLRANDDGSATDLYAVAAGVLSVFEQTALSAPLMLAIDDLQWLDISSMHVIAFAARRVRGRIAILGTERVGASDPGAVWFQMGSPEQLNRVRVDALDTTTLHAVIAERLGVTLPRPLMSRIYGISGGNPLYALELVRAMGPSPAGAGTSGDTVAMPATLTALVESRIGDLDAKVRHVLLAAACSATSTVELIAHAADTDTATVVRLLEVPEEHGIIRLVGNTVHFEHPLLAHGVYTQAGARKRRAMHRRLAQVVAEPELRARHLALATTTADAAAVEALDAAAASSFARGAPASAAELLELAIRLGGDTDERRIRSAGFHAGAGDPLRANGILEECVARLEPGELRAQALLLLGTVRHFNNDMVAGAELFDQACREAGDNLALRVTARLAAVHALYNAADAVRALARAEQAVADATQLGDAGLLAQALGFLVIMRFVWGDGVDEEQLQRALELESRAADVPIQSQPSMHRAQLLNWSGHFDDAIEKLSTIRRACLDRGQEGGLLLVAVQLFLAEVCRGNLAAAAAITEDTASRVQMLDGEVPRCVVQSMRCGVAAFAGRHDETRSTGAEVIAASIRCGLQGLAYAPMGFVGMLENAGGNHQAALDVVAPALFSDSGFPSGPELAAAPYLPEGIEALIHLGRHDEAEPFIAQLEQNGARVDRPWTLAIAARYRAMLQGAGGDLVLAARTAQTAMEHHDRVNMPLERARTQLLVGQLQRRLRQRDSAAKTLQQALTTFERHGATVWADHARQQLARFSGGHGASDALSPSELRIARLAGSGMTNREVAAALLISPKTVEANLARIYRKLGIRSRAELGGHMSRSSEARGG